MASKTPIVYLGFIDEQIRESGSSSVDFTANKIGGKPVSRAFLETRSQKLGDIGKLHCRAVLYKNIYKFAFIQVLEVPISNFYYVASSH